MTLLKFDEYKAPWEVDAAGADIPAEEQVLDGPRLKKFLHGLLSDKTRLQTKVTEVTGERDTLKGDLEAATSKDATADQLALREHQKALDAATAAGDLKALRLEVALGIEGITPAQARKIAARLTGKDQDELEADAKSLAEDFGIGAVVEAEAEEERPTVAGRPRRPVASGAAGATGSDLPDVNDVEAMAKAFPRT